MNTEEQWAIIEAATPEPWSQSQHSIERDYVFDSDVDPVAVATTRRGNAGALQRNEKNATFIAAARTEWPEALKTIEAVLEAVNKPLPRRAIDLAARIRAILEQAKGGSDG